MTQKLILVLNCGSSSLKGAVLDNDSGEVLLSCLAEKLNLPDAYITFKFNGEKHKVDLSAKPDHTGAVEALMEELKAHGLDSRIGAIGHRVVSGGELYSESILVDDEVIAGIEKCIPLAPLHNYAEADVIEICREMFPSIGNVIVADTSFHYNIPEKAWRYALPRHVVDKLHIRKYGAHGTSHRYIWRCTSEFLKGDVHKLVSCHLGSGASLCAIEDGHVKDTTMGLTPLDGLIMGTRCGTLDPATVFYLNRVGGYSIDEIDTMMNKQSGLLALSGVSSDSRDIEAGAAKGDKNCQMALDMFYYRTSQLIAEMAQSMHGFDTMAFSAGIGENSAEMRLGVAKELEWLGVKIDEKANEVRSDDPRVISTPDSKVKVLVVPTNEEYMIALDVEELLSK